jgi:AcrR family transcriptional regulator
MTPSRQQRKEKITRMRKQQILNAAMNVFSRKGFAAATTAEIARTAGIAEGTIYRYFPSKRELFVAVIRNFIITPPLLELIDRLPKGDFTATFRQILQNRFELIESGLVAHIPTLLSEAQRDPELKALVTKQFLQPFLSRMEDAYRELSESGKYRRLETTVTVRCIGGMLLGFLILKMMEGEASPMNRLPQDEIARSMMDLIFHGLLEERVDDNTK